MKDVNIQDKMQELEGDRIFKKKLIILLKQDIRELEAEQMNLQAIWNNNMKTNKNE